MKRQYDTFPIESFPLFKLKLFNWIAGYNISIFLDNHRYPSLYSNYECIAAAGCLTKFELKEDFFSSLSSFVSDNDDWIFGHLTYDIKNQIEELQSSNIDNVKFPETFLFVPEIVFVLRDTELTIGTTQGGGNDIFSEIILHQAIQQKLFKVRVSPRISEKEYITNVKKLQQHIRAGECYEINYCQEFYSENVNISAAAVYQLLSQVSPNPFSAFYRLEDKYVMCASPERYLKKKGQNIISQPIKGTAKRAVDDKEDKEIKLVLANSKKERRENIIVVDLVRNDLSRICEKGSVYVEELCAVYTFPGVHQMMSTIKGTLARETGFGEIIKATFPMGSMTGAPKKRVMELIEKHEKTKRGIYSGTIGYITPEKDFDFNVVIRSIFYNEAEKYLSYQVGSAITFASDPEKEYEECLVKAAAITQILCGGEDTPAE